MIFLTGDTHRDYDIAKLCGKPFNNNDVIIVLGDFGWVWEFNPKLFSFERQLLKEYLDNIGCEVLWLDGNHENHDRINMLPKEERYGGIVHKVCNKCYHLMRGETYNIQGKKFLVCGGAESIDRKYRVEGKSWWKSESITSKDIAKAKHSLSLSGGVDYVLTHCLPTSYKAFLLADGLLPFGKINTETSCVKLEELLEDIEKLSKKPKWYCGHYHIDKDYGDFQVLYNNIIKIN